MQPTYRVTSFTRTFLSCITKQHASQRFAKCALDAAFKRYPNAYIISDPNAGTLHVHVPHPTKPAESDPSKECCILLIQANPTTH